MSAVEPIWRAVDEFGIIAPKTVSRASKWGDVQWTFDHPNRDTIPSNRRIVWNVKLADGSCLTDRKHAPLLEAAQLFTWSMRVSPPHGRLPQKASTLMKTGDYAIMLIKWMVANGFSRFSELTREDVSRYISWVRRRKGRTGGAIDSYTVGCIARVVEDIYLQRRLLIDAIDEPPFEKGEAPSDLMRRRTITPTDQIPDAFARQLFIAAESWVQKGEQIARFYNCYQAELKTIRRAGTFRHVSARSRKTMEPLLAWRNVENRRPSSDDLPEDCPPLKSQGDLTRAYDYLVCACAIVTAMLTGMRVSELLSIRLGCISHVVHRRSRRRYAYVVSRQHKIKGSDQGIIMKWIAPKVVVRALALLTTASRTLRRDSGYAELFLTRHGLRGRVTGIEKRRLESRLNRFAKGNHVGERANCAWKVKMHQCRRTFARFVARRDHTGLVALSFHLKHITLAMTDEGYVGTDFSLGELIDEEIEATLFSALQSVWNGEPLAGPMGERISRRIEFLGRAGGQQGKDFQRFILQETQLILIPDIFGDCVFAPEDALCEGHEERRGLQTCMDCSNLLIRQEHRVFWEEYVQRCKGLIKLSTSRLQVAPIRARLKKAETFLRQLDEERRAIS